MHFMKFIQRAYITHIDAIEIEELLKEELFVFAFRTVFFRDTGNVEENMGKYPIFVLQRYFTFG